MELVAEKSATILWDYLDVSRLICGKIFVDFVCGLWYTVIVKGREHSQE